MISRRSVLAALSGAFVGACGFASFAFGIEPAWRLVKTRYRIRPPRWPEGQRLRIACIADLHASEPQMGLKRIADVVAMTNAEKPDIILMLGDYGIGQKIYARQVDRTELAAVLKDLSAPLGRYAILGNHDYWGGSMTNWPYTHEKVRDYSNRERHMLEAAGIRVLENEVARLDHGGFGFWLAGTGSLIAVPTGRSRFISYAKLDETLAQVSDAAPVLLMAHEPDLFPTVPERVSLTMSGHTHGGQVRLFGYSPITPSDYGNRFAYGHIVENNRNLVVSGGLGTSVLPVRFGVPPEIVIIDLG